MAFSNTDKDHSPAQEEEHSATHEELDDTEHSATEEEEDSSTLEDDQDEDSNEQEEVDESDFCDDDDDDEEEDEDEDEEEEERELDDEEHVEDVLSHDEGRSQHEEDSLSYVSYDEERFQHEEDCKDEDGNRRGPWDPQTLRAEEQILRGINEESNSGLSNPGVIPVIQDQEESGSAMSNPTITHSEVAETRDLGISVDQSGAAGVVSSHTATLQATRGEAPHDMEHLQDTLLKLEEENTFLKEDLNKMRQILGSLQTHTTKGPMGVDDNLQEKFNALEIALQTQMLITTELKREADNARRALERRACKRNQVHASFEVLVVQRPQEVTMVPRPLSPSDQEAATCPICFEYFDQDSGWYTLNCGHRYHLLCLAQVMPTRTRCCICNNAVSKILYEIFGMASRYPDDTRLWDPQTGQPVDFTVEDDLHGNSTDASEETEEVEGEDREEETQETEEVVGEDIEEETEEVEGGDRDEETQEVEGEDRDEETQEVEGEHSLTEEVGYIFSLIESEPDDPNDPDYAP